MNQIKAYFRELVLEEKNRKSKTVLILPLVMGIVVSYVVKDLIYVNFGGTRTSLFTLTCACLWIGIFNSIQSICSIRGRIKIQYMQGGSISAFVIANVLYQLILSVIQSVLITVVFCLIAGVPEQGVFLNPSVEYLILIFLMIFSSDMLGLLISSFSRDTAFAMTLMPFFLVTEMIFSNALFELNEVLDWVAVLMLSRWGVDGFGATAGMESEAIFPEITYTCNPDHFAVVCLVLIGFSIMYILLSILRLKQIDKERLF